MQYLSTRGGISPVSFSEAVMMGLAEDGGLLLPRTVPRIDRETLAAWQELSYPKLALEIMSRFIDDIPRKDLEKLINRSCETFDSEAVTPLVKYSGVHILELWHGPTLAFKDVALQFLGNLFEYLLEKSGTTLNIVGATSGDTGSAAIAGVRGKERIKIFILHPKDRVSPVQERQMTTVLDDNVVNIAIQGSFDDGQAIVKALFNDTEFKHSHNLGAVNSINWARILAQVVYYVHSTLTLKRTEKEPVVDFAVPTGNFGDIFAGYIARKMLPRGTLRNLVLATNDNDILSRMVDSGDYSLGEVRLTSSPSMDIQAASNFERYLYCLSDCSATRTKQLMETFAAAGEIDLSGSSDQIKRDFVTASISGSEVEQTICSFAEENDCLIDPHTAVGVAAAAKHRTAGIPMVCLATAHPAKFPEVVEKATGKTPPIPPQLDGLMERPSRCITLPAEIEEVKRCIEKQALSPTDAG